MQIYNPEHRNRDIRSEYRDAVTRYQENLKLVSQKFVKLRGRHQSIYESLNESINTTTISGHDMRMLVK